MTDISTSRTRSLLLALVVVLSVVAMPAMAAVTYDTETTDTATTSDWTQDTTVTDLDNSSKTSRIEVSSTNASSGDDFTLKVAVNDTNSAQDNTTIYETSESWTATNSSAGYYELNVTHSEVFDDLERDSNQNITLDVTVIVNESETSEEKQTIQIHAQNGDTTAVITASSGEDSIETSNKTGFASFDLSSALSMVAFWSDSSSDDDTFDGAARNTESVNVSATNTSTVRMEFVDSDTSDAASTVLEDADSGDFLGTAGATVAGDQIPVFAEDASDVSWIDTSTDTYATLHDDHIVYHNANESVSSDGSVEFGATLNDGIGVGTASDMLANYDDLGTTEKWSLALGANDFNGDAFSEGVI